MSDERERLLAQFQRKNEETAKPPQDDDGVYHAYKAVDRKQRRLLIRPVSTAWEWATYQYLLRVVVDPTGRRLALIFSFMAITLKGRNLVQIAEAVADERCDFIQQFDGKRWQEPADQQAAFVESIEFITKEAPMSAAQEAA